MDTERFASARSSATARLEARVARMESANQKLEEQCLAAAELLRLRAMEKLIQSKQAL
jgi:hypothetical protein